MANYRSEFCSLKGVQYKIEIVTNSADTTYNELTLAGGSSVKLDWNNSETPFDPIRTSTLSMTFLHDSYLDDLLKPHADDVLVRMYTKRSGSWMSRPEFIGYLNQAGSQNAGYVDCIEEVTLTANDILQTAQFKKYTNKSGTSKKQVVTYQDILEKFMDLYPIYSIKWAKSKLAPDELYTYITNAPPLYCIPGNLYISENNFYSSDTDSAWDWQHVIESIAKYFGFTAMMWHDTLYFFDLLAYSRVDENTFNTVRLGFYEHIKGSSYWGPASDETGTIKKIVASSYRGSNNQISHYPVYNKVKVVDNYYQVGELIPSPLADENLVPEYESRKACRFNKPRTKPCVYKNKEGDSVADAGENYLYYKRELKNKCYDSHFYSGNTELTQAQLDEWADYSVEDWYEQYQGTTIRLYGYDIQFWYQSNGPFVSEQFTESGISAVFKVDGGFDTVFIRWNAEWTRDVYGNYVPSFSLLVDSQNYIDCLRVYDYDYQWHEFNDNTRHFYYRIDGVHFYFIPIPDPIESIAPWTYAGYMLVDPWGYVEERFPITQYPPMEMYGNVYYDVPGSENVWFAYLMMTLDNSSNDNSKDFDITFTYNYASNTPTVVKRTATVEPHGQQLIELYAYPSTAIYGGSDDWKIEVNGHVQTFTRKNKTNSVYPKRTNPLRWFKGAKILEIANISIDDYKNEIPSDISFNRALCISQQGGTTGTTATTNLNRYASVYSLKDSVAPALLINNKTGIIIDADVTFERYWGTDYINPDWSGEQTKGIDVNPALMLVLGIGNKYWNGSQWTTTKAAFAVPLQWKNAGTEKDIDNNVYNTGLHIRNQVSWDTWTGEKGYYIPLNGVDLNGVITFDIRMPREIQGSSTIQDDMNGMCWINKLDIVLGTKGRELDDLNDIVYENIIDSDAVNEIQPISLDITSYPEVGKMSYSHIGYRQKLMPKTRDIMLYAEEAPQEENLIQRYVHQFQTKTTVKDLDLNLSDTKFYQYTEEHGVFAFIDTYDDNDEYKPYVILGQSNDYYMDLSSVHLMELKKYYEYPECNVVKAKFSDNNYPETIYFTNDYNNRQVDKKVTQSGSSYIVEYIFQNPISYFDTTNFKGLTNLTDVWLPDTISKAYSLTYMKPAAFSGCTNLSHIAINSTKAPRLFTDTFEGLANDGYLEVPANADYNDWYAALPEGWSGIIFADPSTTIGVGSVYTVCTKNMIYVGSQASNLRASSNQNWVSTNIALTSGNQYVLTMAVSENKKASLRQAIITVSDGVQTKFITINQSAAAKVLKTNPPINSAVSITFNAQGTPKATSNNYVDIDVITNSDGSDVTFTPSADWINANWKDSLWIENEDGTIHRALRFNCDKAGINRNGTIVISNGTTNITASIAQDGEAKIEWIFNAYRAGAGRSGSGWLGLSYNDRDGQIHWNAYSTDECILPRIELRYEGMSDFNSGSSLTLKITQTNSNFTSYYVPLQIDTTYTGPGYVFVPCFEKCAQLAQYWEWFMQPAWGNPNGGTFVRSCAYPWDKSGSDFADWNLTKGVSVGSEVKFEVLQQDIPIALTNKVAYLKLKS